MHVHPDFRRQLAEDRIARLKDDWARSRPRHGRAQPAFDPATVELRLDTTADDPALERLSALAERRLPRGRFVLAEVEGEIVAALPLLGGEPLRDPFRRTAHLVRLLEVRAAQLKGDPPPRRGLLLRLLPGEG